MFVVPDGQSRGHWQQQAAARLTALYRDTNNTDQVGGLITAAATQTHDRLPTGFKQPELWPRHSSSVTACSKLAVAAPVFTGTAHKKGHRCDTGAAKGRIMERGEGESKGISDRKWGGGKGFLICLQGTGSVFDQP